MHILKQQPHKSLRGKEGNKYILWFTTIQNAYLQCSKADLIILWHLSRSQRYSLLCTGTIHYNAKRYSEGFARKFSKSQPVKNDRKR